ncbi:hypothetical protein K1719_032952 [Acacia pycnantha]|nr:hypothetical protein K1719_032952 [Acacia pycnantha]
MNRPTDTHQVPSSADDVEKIRRDIDSLKNRFPTSMKLEKELLDQYVELIFSHHKRKGFDFSSVLAELKQKTESLLRNLPASSRNDDTETRENQNGFKPLSQLQEKIMEKLKDNAIVKSLLLSYDFLDPVELRICLLLLAIFPENVVLKKRLIIFWWIGEGLVRNEEKGEEIFRKLLELGFIMPHCIDRRPTVNKCKIHPWIRYMLLSVAINKEKLLHLDKGIPRFDPTISQRVCLIDDSTNLISKDGSETKDWRTIFNISGRFLSIDSKCFAKSKFGVLQLGRWQVYSPSHHIEVQDQSFLEGLRTQKHLKYLSLRGISRITTLPDSIKELVSLEILDLKACHNLETLPAAIASLRKLTHLDVSECYMLESMPNGLDNLTSLRVLKGFIIGNSHRIPIRIGNLQKLEYLERLSIHIGSEAVVLEDEFDKLKFLEKRSWILKASLTRTCQNGYVLAS